MADATSSGGSGHSERSHKKTHHRTCAGSKARISDNDSSWDLPSPSSEERLIGKAKKKIKVFLGMLVGGNKIKSRESRKWIRSNTTRTNFSFLGEAVQYLNGDREVVRQAVAIVLGATARKRGLKGAISICTEVSNLLQINRR